MMKTHIALFFIAFLLFSCGENQKKVESKDQHQNEPLTMDKLAKDTTKILVAELPVHFDSTNSLIHPIGYASKENRGSKSALKRESYSDNEYSSNGSFMDNSKNDLLSGNITNLVFEDLKCGHQQLLTTKMICITNVQYLREIWRKTKHQYLLYSVIDKDINHDGLLSIQDRISLYISNADGTGFRKLTKESHYVKDEKLIVGDLKYFFRTYEDSNNNGRYDVTDANHYYFINFANDPYIPTEYFPLKLITK